LLISPRAPASMPRQLVPGQAQREEAPAQQPQRPPAPAVLDLEPYLRVYAECKRRSYDCKPVVQLIADQIRDHVRAAVMLELQRLGLDKSIIQDLKQICIDLEA